MSLECVHGSLQHLKVCSLDINFDSRNGQFTLCHEVVNGGYFNRTPVRIALVGWFSQVRYLGISFDNKLGFPMPIANCHLMYMGTQMARSKIFSEYFASSWVWLKCVDCEYERKHIDRVVAYVRSNIQHHALCIQMASEKRFASPINVTAGNEDFTCKFATARERHAQPGRQRDAIVLAQYAF